MAGERGARAGFWLTLAVACGACVPLGVLAQSQPNKNRSTQGSAVSKKRLVCWTDEGGNRACGDSIPPQYADREKEILDGSGRTVKVIPGALTPEQRAAQAEQATRDAAAQREADQQAAYDRALLATYSRAEELADLRDDRLATLDTSIGLIESAVRRDTVSVAELRSRVPQGKQPEGGLKANLARFETSLAENQRAIADLRKNRDAVCTTFARDIRRFQELKSGTVSFESPCPAPGSIAPGKELAVDLAGARRFFDRFIDLERDYDPAMLELYADTAVIKTTRKGGDGQIKESQVKMADYRKQAEKALPAAKTSGESYAYADVKVEPVGPSRARISGTRTAERSGASTPFYLVAREGSKGWRIVESGTGPQ